MISNILQFSDEIFQFPLKNMHFIGREMNRHPRKDNLGCSIIAKQRHFFGSESAIATFKRPAFLQRIKNDFLFFD